MKSVGRYWFLKVALLGVVGGPLVVGSVRADESASDVLGITTISCPGGSDTYVGVPFEQHAVFEGVLESVPVVEGDRARVVPVLESNLVGNAFAGGSHYLRFVGSGPLSGAWFEVVSNAIDEITIEHRGVDITSAVVGNGFEVIPFWTLGGLLPPGSQETLHVSPGKLPHERQSLLLLADNTSEGIKLSPDRIFFLTDEGWFRSRRGLPAAGGQIVRPGEALIVRHPFGAGDTLFRPTQRVLRWRHWQVLRTNTERSQDNIVTLPRPLPMALSDLGLDAPVFLDSASTDPGDRADELLFYENLQIAVNRIPTSTFFRVGGAWVKDDGAAYPNADAIEVPNGAILVVRKGATVDGAPVFWINSPTY